MCGNRSRGVVVLVFQVLPNCRERDASIASGIDLGLGKTGNDLPTTPVEPISPGGEMAHRATSQCQCLPPVPLTRTP